MPFPFLRLPFLCVQCVFQQIGVIDLTDISIISKKCHRIVKSLPRSLTGFNIKFKDSQLYILFQNKEITRAKYVFDCGKTDFIRSISMNRIKTEMEKFFPEIPDVNQLLHIKYTIVFLTDLFRCPLKDLFFDISTLTPPILSLFDQCECLKIRGENRVSNELLANILERITVKQHLWFQVPTDPSFDFNSVSIKANGIEFRYKSPLSFSSQLAARLNFETVKMLDSHWTSRDCISFVNQWFNSNNTKLKSVAMYFRHTVHVNVDHLNPLPFCEKRRIALRTVTLKNGALIEYTEKVDILRSDGLLATVSTVPDSNYFVFHAWHDRFLSGSM